MFDVRPWIPGSKRKEALDWDVILTKATILRRKNVPLDALVGVIHNIGYWGSKDDALVNLNLFGVILLMTRTP